MTVCRFWQQGRCNKGDHCNFEHPGSERERHQGNRFAALSNTSSGGGFGSRGRSNAIDDNKYGVTQALIRDDLTFATSEATKNGNRPVYPFSCYGPGTSAPKQLIEGPFEQSPEEMRLKYYLAQASGRPEEYTAHETQLANDVNSKVQQILSNPADAVKYCVDISPPNRNDLMVHKPTTEWPYRGGKTATTGGFGQSAQTSGGFGQSSQPSSTFGAPSRPGFGAPSALGSTAARPAFGSPSMGGGSTFGQPSQPAASTGFGAPSALGSKPSPFGGGQQTSASGGFGAPSAIGAKPSPFGGGQQSTTGTGFGAPSTIGAKPSPFGTAQSNSSPFGQAAQSSTPAAPSGFGAASRPGFGQTGFGSTTQAQNPSPFGAASQPVGGGFGAPSGPAAQTGGTAFGQPSSFGTQKPSPFNSTGASTGTGGGFGSAPAQSNPSPFARPSPFAASSNSSTGAFGAPSQPANTGGFGAASRSNPFSQAQAQAATANTPGMPSTWKGARVQIVEKNKENFPCYEVPHPTQPGHTVLERIWFPNGPPTHTNPYIEAIDPAVYEDARLKEIYEAVKTTGKFKDGVMPEIPPKREWIGWDL